MHGDDVTGILLDPKLSKKAHCYIIIKVKKVDDERVKVYLPEFLVVSRIHTHVRIG